MGPTDLSEADQVDYIERAIRRYQVRPHSTEGRIIPDVIRKTLQEFLPISRLPEAEALHLHIVVAHRSICVWSAVYIEVDQFLEVGPDDLISVDEDNLLQIHGEENIQEQDLVSPNDTLFFLLCPQPRWPLVGHELVLEAVCF